MRPTIYTDFYTFVRRNGKKAGEFPGFAVQNPDIAPFLAQQSYQRGTIYVSLTLLNAGWTNISDTQVGIWEKPVGCKVRA